MSLADKSSGIVSRVPVQLPAARQRSIPSSMLRGYCFLIGNLLYKCMVSGMTEVTALRSIAGHSAVVTTYTAPAGFSGIAAAAEITFQRLFDTLAKMKKMASIYHVCGAAAWDAAKEQGLYEHPSLEDEGFIHCSDERQVAGVLKRYFKGQRNLLRLEIQPGRLSSELKWENAPSVGEAFPHIYGPVNIDAVVGIKELDNSEGAS